MAAETQVTQATVASAVTLTQEQLDMLLKAAASGGSQTLSAEELAKAIARTNRTENATAPMVSVYNPKGDTEHPRPTLRAKTYQNGIELSGDTLTWEEIEALNSLQPGEFRVSKANGQKIQFTVQHIKGFDGETLERVEVHYPCKDEHRTDHRGIFEYALDALESAGRLEEVERLKKLRKELDVLRKG